MGNTGWVRSRAWICARRFRFQRPDHDGFDLVIRHLALRPGTSGAATRPVSARTRIKERVNRRWDCHIIKVRILRSKRLISEVDGNGSMARPPCTAKISPKSRMDSIRNLA